MDPNVGFAPPPYFESKKCIVDPNMQLYNISATAVPPPTVQYPSQQVLVDQNQQFQQQMQPQVQPTIVNVTSAPPTTIVTTAAPQTTGNCPSCRAGMLYIDWSCCGWCCAIFFFPIGLLCFFFMTKRRCGKCHRTFFLCQ